MKNLSNLALIASIIAVCLAAVSLTIAMNNLDRVNQASQHWEQIQKAKTEMESKSQATKEVEPIPEYPILESSLWEKGADRMSFTVDTDKCFDISVAVLTETGGTVEITPIDGRGNMKIGGSVYLEGKNEEQRAFYSDIRSRQANVTFYGKQDGKFNLVIYCLE